MNKTVIIELYGDVHKFEIQNDETILEAALRNYIDAPYSCMSGTCNSCQAKLVEGKVVMDEAEALSEDEIKAGEILTCCSQPETDQVRVKYPD